MREVREEIYSPEAEYLALPGLRDADQRESLVVSYLRPERYVLVFPDLPDPFLDRAGSKHHRLFRVQYSYPLIPRALHPSDPAARLRRSSDLPNRPAKIANNTRINYAKTASSLENSL